jgi:hypothetical protein
MEMYDDIAWEQRGTPAELKQLKLHVTALPNLTNASDDLWRTLRVWMDASPAGDPYGPILTLITNSTAGDGSAASYLRVSGRDVGTALDLLEKTAQNSAAEGTKKAREQFLRLTATQRAAFVGRIYIADQSPDLDGVDEEVAALIRPGAPTEQFQTYLDQIWGWWGRTSIAMLKGEWRAVSVRETLTALERIRDQFTRDNLPSLIAAEDVDPNSLGHEERTYVHQLKLLNLTLRPLQKAIIDYQRAYLQETRWLDIYLVDYDELNKFTSDLIDEWEREYDHMCGGLPEGASEADKQAAGRYLLHSLSNSTLSIRTKFQEPFHARGRRHALADEQRIGWHPEFEAHLAALLLPGA